MDITTMDTRQESRLGPLLAEARARKGLSQADMADLLGMSRGNYGHVESSRRRDPLTPEQATAICKALDLDLYTLLRAMGFPINTPSFEKDEPEVLLAFRKATPATKDFIRRGLGLL